MESILEEICKDWTPRIQEIHLQSHTPNGMNLCTVNKVVFL
jgi:hypothetical protein